jgi:hypothetical protein
VVALARTREDDAVLAEDSNAGAGVVDGLDGVLHLVQPPCACSGIVGKEGWFAFFCFVLDHTRT